jgi:uncharacterized glyoxalase superfamily protein PhnB
LSRFSKGKESTPEYFCSKMTRAIILAAMVLFSVAACHRNTKTNKRMKARFSILTIGVDTLERAYKFYHEGLGLASKGIVGTEFEHGAVAFFELAGGVQLAMYERANLAWDAQLPIQSASSTEFSIGHFVRNKEEVDEVMEQARKAGAKIVKPAQKTFWGGYGGYFQDPDGHLWEIAYNPTFIPVD